MATIQIVLDNDLLEAADGVAKKEKINRSALVRRALQAHLKQIRLQEMVDREIKAYQDHPPSDDEMIPVEYAAWPEH